MKKIIENNKNIIMTLFIFITFGIIVMFSMRNVGSLYYDTIWSFHAVQKVANGYTMYTEINTVLTPIFFWMGSFFVKIFGNTISSLHIFSGVIGGAFAAIMYNIVRLVAKDNNKSILFLTCCMFLLKYIYSIGEPNYNILALLWWFGAIYLEIKNAKQKTENSNIFRNIAIGILVGLTIFTKQSIGVPAFISIMLIAFLKKKLDNKEDTSKEILSKILGILLVVLGMLIYFIFSNSFYTFVDYCIGGLLDFGSNNIAVSFSAEWFVIIFFIVLGLILSIDKEKDKVLMILTIFQICICTLLFPNSNSYHMDLVKLAILPLFVAIANFIHDEKMSKISIIFFSFIMLIVSMYFVDSTHILTPYEEMFYAPQMSGSEALGVGMYICFFVLVLIILFKKEKIANVIAVLVTVGLIMTEGIISIELSEKEKIPEQLSIYTGINCSEAKLEYINDVLEYILEQEKNGKRVLVVSVDASYYMAPLNRNNYIYDFGLLGCLGFRGEKKLINNLELDEDTIILKNEYMMYQESKKLDEYIKQNCKRIDKIRDLEVYQKL